MKKTIFASCILSFVLATALTSVAFAGVPQPAGGTISGDESPPAGAVATKADLVNLINTILNYVFIIFIVGSTILIILSGFQFITAGGDAAKVSEARMKLLWSIVGVLVALVARGLPTLVRTLLGA